jgi:hypothetical protein
MRFMHRRLAPLLIVAGCSSSSSAGPTDDLANQCASKGATYLQSFTETSGTCGPLSSIVVKINSDGTFYVASPVHCTSVEQDGCTTSETDCQATVDGVTGTFTFDTTFAADGSEGTGVETYTLTNGSSTCMSTYDVTFTKQ